MPIYDIEYWTNKWPTDAREENFNQLMSDLSRLEEPNKTLKAFFTSFSIASSKRKSASHSSSDSLSQEFSISSSQGDSSEESFGEKGLTYFLSKLANKKTPDELYVLFFHKIKLMLEEYPNFTGEVINTILFMNLDENTKKIFFSMAVTEPTLLTQDNLSALKDSSIKILIPYLNICLLEKRINTNNFYAYLSNLTEVRLDQFSSFIFKNLESQFESLSISEKEFISKEIAQNSSLSFFLIKCSGDIISSENLLEISSNLQTFSDFFSYLALETLAYLEKKYFSDLDEAGNRYGNDASFINWKKIKEIISIITDHFVRQKITSTRFYNCLKRVDPYINGISFRIKEQQEEIGERVRELLWIFENKLILIQRPPKPTLPPDKSLQKLSPKEYYIHTTKLKSWDAEVSEGSKRNQETINLFSDKPNFRDGHLYPSDRENFFTLLATYISAIGPYKDISPNSSKLTDTPRLLTEPAAVQELGVDSEYRIEICPGVPEDSSTESINKPSAEVELCKKPTEVFLFKTVRIEDSFLQTLYLECPEFRGALSPYQADNNTIANFLSKINPNTGVMRFEIQLDSTWSASQKKFSNIFFQILSGNENNSLLFKDSFNAFKSICENEKNFSEVEDFFFIANFYLEEEKIQSVLFDEEDIPASQKRANIVEKNKQAEFNNTQRKNVYNQILCDSQLCKDLACLANITRSSNYNHSSPQIFERKQGKMSSRSLSWDTTVPPNINLRVFYKLYKESPTFKDNIDLATRGTLGYKILSESLRDSSTHNVSTSHMSSFSAENSNDSGSTPVGLPLESIPLSFNDLILLYFALEDTKQKTETYENIKQQLHEALVTIISNQDKDAFCEILSHLTRFSVESPKLYETLLIIDSHLSAKVPLSDQPTKASSSQQSKLTKAFGAFFHGNNPSRKANASVLAEENKRRKEMLDLLVLDKRTSSQVAKLVGMVPDIKIEGEILQYQNTDLDQTIFQRFYDAIIDFQTRVNKVAQPLSPDSEEVNNLLDGRSLTK